MTHDWSKLNHLQIGRFAEYRFKMQLVLYGLDVFSSEVDDRGIDFVIRQEPSRYWDVQVKSARNLNYVFLRKDRSRIRPNLLLGLALFEDGKEPDMYLIPISRWATPDELFVDRDYDGLKSQPEYGLNLSRRRLAELLPFRFDVIAPKLFAENPLP
jgi:hypothetical protein